MPRKRFFRRKYARRSSAFRRYRRKRRYGRRKLSLRRLSYVRNKRLVWHKYGDRASISIASLAPNSHVFACNDIHAPNVTGSTHSPMGVDQLEAQYSTYTVLAATINVACYLPNSTDEFIVGLGIKRISTSTEWPQNVKELMEDRSGIFRSAAVTANCTQKTLILRQKWSRRHMSKAKWTPTDVGASPTDAEYWVISFSNLTDSTSAVSLECRVFIKYLVLWEQAKRQAIST